MAVVAVAAAGEGRHTRRGGRGGDARAVGAGDPMGQHRLRRGSRDAVGRGRGERVHARAVDREGDAGVGAELAHPHGQRRGPARADRAPARGGGGGQDEDGVHRPKLAKERDRLGPRGAQVEERPPRAETAGEADRLDERMAHHGVTQVVAVALQQREHARRHAGRADCVEDRARDQLGRAGMGRVTLDDDRAARRQRRRRVAARGREGEREVRGAEHRNRPKRALHQPQVGAGRGLAVGQRRVVAQVEMAPRLDMVGEQPQLAGGAPGLAHQPRLGQAGLGHGAGYDRVAARVDSARDGAQEGGAVGARSGGEIREGSFGHVGGAPHLGGTGALHRQRRGIAHRHGGEAFAPFHPFARDQVQSGQCHRQSSNASVTTRRPSMKASATSTCGRMSTSARRVAIRSAKRA